jgi:hypothetical protein
MDFKAVRFIDEVVEVRFRSPPVFTKKPGCPDEFTWRGRTYRIVHLITEWHDYGRRGRMAHNMRPEHAATAQRAGSWGVGRDHYRVRTDSNDVFDLCYDRAPRSAKNRQGGWFLLWEMTAARKGETE